MLFLIGYGLDVNDLSLKGIEALKKCKKIYIESYTTTIDEKFLDVFKRKLKKGMEKETCKSVEKIIEIASREKLENESNKLLETAKKENIAILVYGDPLIATTHIALIREAKKAGVKTEIIHNVSVLNAIGRIGLSVYKFGKIANVVEWHKNYAPKSFYNVIQQNLSINAHTLLLVEPGLDFQKALEQLIESDAKNLLSKKKIFVCSRLGTRKEKIFFDYMKNYIKNLKKIKKVKKVKRVKDVVEPFCFVIPAEMEFYEKEAIAELILRKNFKAR